MKKGFTLIELLIVVAIIGILAAVGAVIIPNMLTNAKIAAAKQNFKTVETIFRAEEAGCHIGKELFLGFISCKYWTPGRRATLFFSRRNITHGVHLYITDMSNPYKIMNPLSKDMHPIVNQCCVETGQIMITVATQGTVGVVLTSAVAPYKEGTKTKLRCDRGQNQDDPNCLNTFIAFE